MRNYSMLVSAAMAASFTVPATAQDAPAQDMMEEPVPQPPAQVTPEQQAMLDGWPVEQRAQYDAWPPVTQSYYWSLSPNRQNLFWRITDTDKVRVSQMTPDEQAAAWESVERAVAAQQAAPPPPAEPAPQPEEVPTGEPETPMQR
ncbi:hypothetical protein [Parerythrobacter lacustris]|uniref:Secreted protein n=1 Tax=Parerythrobacter lacustris TaxID=2969984 RepID=A0ABT1XSC7_9SPHN|nr:hypothetical protein [Parerythrobacter lacustris]MCR2834559.1 hypothetical protein [Parerythrobacter lacustris]